MLGIGEGFTTLCKYNHKKLVPCWRTRSSEYGMDLRTVTRSCTSHASLYWIIAEHSWRHTFYFSFSLTLLPIVLIYFFTSNFPQENKYVNVLELQKINKSTTEEVLHKNGSEKFQLLNVPKVYLCNSNFWILLAVFLLTPCCHGAVVT